MGDESEQSLSAVLADNSTKRGIPKARESAPVVEKKAEPVKAKTEPVKASPEKSEPVEKVEEKSATTAQTETQSTDSGEETDDHPVPRKALIEERKKRQEYERLLAETNGKLQAFQQFAQQRQAPQDQARPDPEAEFYKNPTQFVGSTVQEQVDRVRLDLSQQMMRSAHADYDEKANAFVEAAQQNPSLVMQLRSHPNPAQFAYDTGKVITATRGAKSWDEAVANIRKDLRAEIEAEIRKERALTAAEQASTSSATAPGRSASQVQAAGDVPLRELFPARW